MPSCISWIWSLRTRHLGSSGIIFRFFENKKSKQAATIRRVIVSQYAYLSHSWTYKVCAGWCYARICFVNLKSLSRESGERKIFFGPFLFASEFNFFVQRLFLDDGKPKLVSKQQEWPVPDGGGNGRVFYVQYLLSLSNNQYLYTAAFRKGKWKAKHKV